MNPLLEKTYGELLDLNTPEAEEILKSEGINRERGFVTIDKMRGVKMTVRKWRMLRRIKAVSQ